MDKNNGTLHPIRKTAVGGDYYGVIKCKSNILVTIIKLKSNEEYYQRGLSWKCSIKDYLWWCVPVLAHSRAAPIIF